MARRRMVTREIKQTTAEVMGVMTDTNEPTTLHVVVSGEYSSEEKLLKAIKKVYDDEEQKIVHICSYETDIVLRGMYEEDFILQSMILDDVTRKPIVTEETE